jgi:hypothetical protein
MSSCQEDGLDPERTQTIATAEDGHEAVNWMFAATAGGTAARGSSRNPKRR